MHSQKDVTEPMPGYLSLHQMTNSLTVKWTPNQLMNGDLIDKSSNFWGYALNINVDEIVYVHCHQSSTDGTGGTIVFVGQDGVQRSPIHFPEGGHMAAFLSCLETGLLPHGQLDPPLWSPRGMGKILNKSRRRPLPSLREASVEDVPIERDYVFRVVNKSNHADFCESSLRLIDIHIYFPTSLTVNPFPSLSLVTSASGHPRDNGGGAQP